MLQLKSFNGPIFFSEDVTQSTTTTSPMVGQDGKEENNEKKGKVQMKDEAPENIKEAGVYFTLYPNIGVGGSKRKSYISANYE